MLRVILKHLNFLVLKNRDDEKKFEARRKFEENLRALQESDDDEAEVDENDNRKNDDPVVELTWSCSKYEGKFYMKIKHEINPLKSQRCHHIS